MKGSDGPLHVQDVEPEPQKIFRMGLEPNGLGHHWGVREFWLKFCKSKFLYKIRSQKVNEAFIMEYQNSIFKYYLNIFDKFKEKLDNKEIVQKF